MISHLAKHVYSSSPGRAPYIREGSLSNLCALCTVQATLPCPGLSRPSARSLHRRECKQAAARAHHRRTPACPASPWVAGGCRPRTPARPPTHPRRTHTLFLTVAAYRQGKEFRFGRQHAPATSLAGLLVRWFGALQARGPYSFTVTLARQRGHDCRRPRPNPSGMEHHRHFALLSGSDPACQRCRTSCQRKDTSRLAHIQTDRRMQRFSDAFMPYRHCLLLVLTRERCRRGSVPLCRASFPSSTMANHTDT